MSVSSAQTSVTTTATAIETGSGAGPERETIMLINTGATDCVLGGAGVTALTGYTLKAGATLVVDVEPGDALFGIVGVGTTTVGALKINR